MHVCQFYCNEAACLSLYGRALPYRMHHSVPACWQEFSMSIHAFLGARPHAARAYMPPPHPTCCTQYVTTMLVASLLVLLLVWSDGADRAAGGAAHRAASGRRTHGHVALRDGVVSAASSGSSGDAGIAFNLKDRPASRRPLVAGSAVAGSVAGADGSSTQSADVPADPAQWFVPLDKPCDPGCTARGNCNIEDGRCECPFGYTGDDDHVEGEVARGRGSGGGGAQTRHEARVRAMGLGSGLACPHAKGWYVRPTWPPELHAVVRWPYTKCMLAVHACMLRLHNA